MTDLGDGFRLTRVVESPYHKRIMNQLSYIVTAAVALLLIFEGFLPFVAPRLWRKVMQHLINQRNHAIQIAGLISMVIGVILLCLAHYLV